MTFTLNRSDREVLRLLAEHRILTTGQVIALLDRNAQSVRRRLAALEREGLVTAATVGVGRGRGRPEKMLSSTVAGIKALRAGGLLADVQDHRVLAAELRCVDHQILANRFRIHLVRLEEFMPPLEMRFLSPTSPFLELDPEDRPLIADAVRRADEPDRVTFVPDAVFSLTHVQRKMTLLFFLEVDMGTEALASGDRNRRDVRHKILNYQAYFRSDGYKRYERLWGTSIHGFRLLFLTTTEARLAGLCSLVRKMPPSDFIWLTDQSRMSTVGAWGAVWARGGRVDKPLESILGSCVPDPGPHPPQAA